MISFLNKTPGRYENSSQTEDKMIVDLSVTLLRSFGWESVDPPS